MKIKNYGLILTYLFINIIIFISINNFNDLIQEKWIKFFAYTILTQTILGIFLIKKMGEKIYSLANLMIIFSFILHFGHVVLEGFSIETYRVFEWIRTDDVVLVRKVCIYGMKSQFSLILGVMLYFRKKYYKNSKKLLINTKNEIINLKKINFIAKILIMIGLPFSITINYIKIQKFIIGSYGDTHLNLSGIFVVLAESFQIGLILMLIGNYNKKNKYYTIMLMLISYQFLIISTGNRARPILIIMTLIYLHNNLKNKISAKKIIKIMPIGYIFLMGIRVMGELRLEKDINFKIIAEKISYIYNQSVIYSILAEFGNTMLSVYYIIKYETEYELRFLSNYINGFLIVFPNLNNFLDKYYLDFIYIENLPKYARFALGGSFFGEAYYSFGEFGYLILVFIGFFSGYISKNIFVSIQEKDWLKLGKFILIFPSLLWWIRSYFSTFLREVSWILILIIILEKVKFNKMPNKNSRNFNSVE